MKRVKIVVAYDGTNYHGWQIQPRENTIEGELGKIIDQDYPKNNVNVKVYTGKAVYNKLSKLNKKLE